jgi:hypothetical protein
MMTRATAIRTRDPPTAVAPGLLFTMTIWPRARRRQDRWRPARVSIVRQTFAGHAQGMRQACSSMRQARAWQRLREGPIRVWWGE